MHAAGDQNRIDPGRVGAGDVGPQGVADRQHRPGGAADHGQSPTIDADFKKGAATFDRKLRQKYYNQFQVEINQKADWIELYYRPQIATADSALGNFKNNPTQYGQTWNAYEWFAKS